ncbi:MAG: hypothetical protein NTV51_08730 [Verrucomicrobia bacterium]|nr:hypothetical protein [Verrucomicrobiota bacterium]
MKRGRGYGIGFAGGICFLALLIFLGKNGVIKRFGSFEYVMVVGSVVLILARLPAFFLAASKEAVPAKSSDWMGYAVILAAVLAAVGIGYSVI